MLDINLFRTDRGGDPEIIRESQRRRFKDVGLVDKVIELDAEWRQVRYQLDSILREFNILNKEIATLRKSGQNTDQQQEKSKDMKKSIVDAEELEKSVIVTRDKVLCTIGNLVHDSVPCFKDEEQNTVVRTAGENRVAAAGEKLYSHVDLVQMLGIVNLEAGSEVAGGRGYYLMREGVLLNQAVINFGLQFAYKRDYSPVQTPFFMRQDIMQECAQLSDFDDQLYKVTGEGDDKYLIATSEQPLCAMHRKGWFEGRELPIKYVGYSTCFRKEVGTHGRDTLGIFRIHQFEKLEQFCITSPEACHSWEAMDEMLGNAEDFYQSLGLPYQVINIVSGALNDAAAKKYDLEAWFPGSKAFRELVSCSNCTDFQSRRLDIRMRTAKGPEGENKKAFVHMLNSTLSATERTLCCILETYQTPEGIRIPPALQPFMMGMEFLPFRKRFDPKGKLVDVEKLAPKAAAADVAGAGAALAGATL
ncbi:MAG: hypothetical protein WDW36_004708 [Sanguina aurantia]